MTKLKGVINQFRGEFYFLSNFSESKIEYDGYTYTNAEAAFHAQKNSGTTYKYLMQFQPPNLAKKEGRKVVLRSDWEQVKDQLMYEIVKAKFMQNPPLAKKLVDTGEVDLVEGNNWHDNYWGSCNCNKPICGCKVPKNKLGKILMRVRDEIKDIDNEEKPLIFEEGKYYIHTTGHKLYICGKAKTMHFGDCLIGENEFGDISPIGELPENAVNYREITREEFLSK